MATHKTPVVMDLSKQTLVTLRTLKTSTDTNPGSLKNYEKIGGYKQLKRIVKDKVKATDIISEVKTSGLRGRGGAG